MSILDKIQSMRPYSDFEFWFTRLGRDCWQVIDKNQGPVCKLVQVGSEVMSSDWESPELETAVFDVLADFDSFCRTRPEYWVGAKVDPENNTIEWAREVYETIIVGLALIRSYESNQQDPDKAADKIITCLKWLQDSGFFYGPSSTQYHESFQGGNLYHHLKVIDNAVALMELPKFRDKVKLSSVVLAAATHDWCKIGAYESFTKKLPNEKGDWVPTQCWKYKDVVLPLGHGVSSMMQARCFFKMSTEEMLAIRWHMGAWRVVDSEMNELQQANENYPLVHLIQFADQLAIVNY